MKLLARVFRAIFASSLRWHYRPESMRPAMRKRAFFGLEQCQVKHASLGWIKAQHPASRYQWKPVKRVKADLSATSNVGSEQA